jgi:hypothetical protein
VDVGVGDGGDAGAYAGASDDAIVVVDVVMTKRGLACLSKGEYGKPSYNIIGITKKG